MKHILFIVALFTFLSGTIASHAQDTASNPKRSTQASFTFSSGTTGSHVQDTAKAKVKKKKATTFTLGSRGFKLTPYNGGMHSGWSHTNATWQATGSYYAMTRIDSDDYIYKITNLRSFYNVGRDTAIDSIAIIFKDSLGAMQTVNIYIPVASRNNVNPARAANVVTTFPAVVMDSTESVIIHFHPYENRNRSFRTYSSTIFIYTGIITNPSDKKTHDSGMDDADMEEGDFESHWGILDLGINTIKDNTNYNSPTVKNFLNAPANRQNSELFKLRQGKSINVDIYPWMKTLYALKRRNQKINISTGIGLQLYNFRYENPITYNKNPGSVTLDNSSFKKDKLGFDYLNIPLMVTFKTRLHGSKWLIYGAGITGGYSIATWTKQEANGHKEKVHDDFSFSDFNSCLTGEIGITGIRFYFSYQLTNMFDNTSGMNQHPISFGIRFFAI